MASAWVTKEDLELALGPSTFLAIFDDGTGAANEDAVDLVLRAAHADVLRYALRGYDGIPPNPPPDELYMLELDFARARAFMRGDMYTRDTGATIFAAARETGKQIADSLQRGGPDMPNPTPALSEPPVDVERNATSMLFATCAPCTKQFMFWSVEGRICRR
jgi:hypothetical protein